MDASSDTQANEVSTLESKTYLAEVQIYTTHSYTSEAKRN